LPLLKHFYTENFIRGHYECSLDLHSIPYPLADDIKDSYGHLKKPASSGNSVTPSFLSFDIEPWSRGALGVLQKHGPLMPAIENAAMLDLG